MTGQIAGKVCAMAMAIVAGQGMCAWGAIIGGQATSSAGGTFLQLDPPPAVVGPDTFQSPDLIAFDEQQDVLLTESLTLGDGRVLGAGSVVSSHYVVFDPLEGAAVDGFVLFDEPIVAIIGGPNGLELTAQVFGAPGTSYSVSNAIGPEGNGGPGGAGDQVGVAPGNRQRLNFTAGAISPGDHVRVLTGSLVPEPAGALSFAIACYLAVAPPWLRRR